MIGMDFMKENDVEFNMKINNSERDESILSFKFDSWEEKED